MNLPLHCAVYTCTHTCKAKSRLKMCGGRGGVTVIILIYLPDASYSPACTRTEKITL